MKYLLILFIVFGSVSAKADHIQKILESNSFKEKYADYDRVMVFDSTSADVQESGLSYVTIKQLIFVNNESGSKNLQTITYDYDPLSAFVEVKSAKIYRKDGSIETLDSTRIFDYPQPARMIYWGARQKMIEPGLLNPGDALYVELFRKGFTYALLQSDDDKYIPPMKGHFYDIIHFYSSIPIHEKVYQTFIPNSKTVNYKMFNADFETKTERTDKTLYCFKLKEILPVKREPNMEGLENIAPKVLITTSPDWEAKSKWFYGVNEDYGSFESTPEIDKKVAEILDGAKDENDSIARLTHWVADEMRYSGISMGEGEGYTLHSGEMNFHDRCGVCKDKAGMLITLLRAAGFESYAAMTMAGSRIEDIPADQFNHSVTIVKHKNGEFEILDPTWVPFVRELWSSREQQQNYLMGLPDGADLSITDISAPENHYLKITNNATITEKGTLKGKVHITAEGQTDAAVRGLFTYYNMSQWRANLEREMLDIYPQSKIEKIEFTDPYSYKEQPVSITYSYSIPDFAVVDGKSYIFKTLTNAGFYKHNRFAQSLRTLKERNYGFRLRCSQSIEIKEDITFPAKIKEVKSPESVGVTTEVATVDAGYETKKENLTFHFNAAYNKRVYTKEEWPDMKNVIEKGQQFFYNPIIVNTK